MTRWNALSVSVLNKLIYQTFFISLIVIATGCVQTSYFRPVVFTFTGR